MLGGMTLTCIECACASDDRAVGWEAHLVDLDDDGADEIVCFCPRCSAREFGANADAERIH